MKLVDTLCVFLGCVYCVWLAGIVHGKGCGRLFVVCFCFVFAFNASLEIVKKLFYLGAYNKGTVWLISVLIKVVLVVVFCLVECSVWCEFGNNRVGPRIATVELFDVIASD